MDLKEIRDVIRELKNELEEVNSDLFNNKIDGEKAYNKLNGVAGGLSVLFYNIELELKDGIPL